MYRAFWNVLPGPLWGRILLAVAVGMGVLALLVFFLFPWLDSVVSRSIGVGT
jgi:hypothetical protein